MSYKINYTAEEKIKLAKDDSVEKLYESKKNQRTVRVLTVLAYVLTVSMAAIILSTYYVFFWNPKHINLIAQSKANCEKIIIPEHIAVRLINNTVISLDTFYNNTMMHLHQIHSNAIKNHARMRDRVEFNRYLETMTYEEVATTMSMDANKKMRRKMKQSKKIVDDEDLNLDMESSGDKDQLLGTTFPPPTSEPSTDMNDTTIIFDQDSDEFNNVGRGYAGYEVAFGTEQCASRRSLPTAILSRKSSFNSSNNSDCKQLISKNEHH